jgi:signal transduction histidine kinase
MQALDDLKAAIEDLKQAGSEALAAVEALKAELLAADPSADIATIITDVRGISSQLRTVVPPPTVSPDVVEALPFDPSVPVA